MHKALKNLLEINAKKNNKKGIVLYNVGPLIMTAMVIAFVLKILHGCGKI